MRQLTPASISRTAVGVAVIFVASACGRGTTVRAAPKPVPLQIVPAQLPGTAGGPPLTLEEYKPGAERIAGAAGSRSMVAEGKVWQIRRGTTLVGALQVSTLKPPIDLSKAKQRATLADLLVSGSVQRIQVGGVEVITAKTPDKVVFLWFGDQLFEVLQIKGVGIDPESMLKNMLDFQKPSGELRIRSQPRS